MEQLPKTDIRVVDQFDFELFWERHGKKVSTAAIAIVVLGLVAFYWQKQQTEKSAAAAAALARAQDAGALQALIQEFSGQELAAQAMLKLADLQYHGSRYNEAADTYKKVCEQYPRHALIESAALGLAASLEAQGDLNRAKLQYEQVVRSYPTGYTTIPARLGLARCAETAGLIKDAKQIYEELLPAVQGSPWQGEVYLRWVALTREQPPETTAATLAGQSQAGPSDTRLPLEIATPPQP
jgi:tetratricopeptide (TPR) repeat protein